MSEAYNLWVRRYGGKALEHMDAPEVADQIEPGHVWETLPDGTQTLRKLAS